MDNSSPKTRTITLTARRPVTIREDRWPIIACARDDSYHGDPSRHDQSVDRGECDRYHLLVRRHVDGRTLVYAVVDAAIAAWGAPAEGEDYRGGELVDIGEPGRRVFGALERAIQRVGELAVEHGLPERLIRETLAALPPEVVDPPEVADTPEVVDDDAQM